MDWTMGPADTWASMAAWLQDLITGLAHRPREILVVSAHWEEPTPTVTTTEAPSLIFDYHGFPPHTYELTWPTPGSPQLADRIRGCLEAAGIPSRSDPARGFDHGVFVPLKVALPDADIPTVELSLVAGLDPGHHLRIGRALAPLRDEGVLIIGSGMSYHNMSNFMTSQALADSQIFDEWLDSTVSAQPEERDRLLANWSSAPAARRAHPREEHLLPLMVMAGAAPHDIGEVIFSGEVMGARVSAHGFGLDRRH